MTKAHCESAFEYCISSSQEQASIRAGRMSAALKHLLPEERDLNGFRGAISIANQEYIHIGPQWATDADRKRVLAIFAEEIQKYIEETYGKSS